MCGNKGLWDKCVAFHGHECPGLTIGYRASLYAIDLLGLSLGGGGNAGSLSRDEDIVCVTENDACGVDAIQVIMGCSVGKGNLLFHMTGKQAFSFYDRNTGKSIRLVLKRKQGMARGNQDSSHVNPGMARAQAFEYYHSCRAEEMFDVKEAKIALPERAKIFDSYVCDCCGETVGDNWIRLRGDKKLCIDCFKAYDRFHV